MREELMLILDKLVEKAKCNSEHSASYDLIGKLNLSDDVRGYIGELIDNKYIENVTVSGHTHFSCIVTKKAFELSDSKNSN